MRILSFCKMWDKLERPRFTTFRFPRKDKEWHSSELVQVYYKSRTPQRKKLGEAMIMIVENMPVRDITHSEIVADGFDSMLEMWLFLGWPDGQEEINKLTLEWVGNPI